MLESENSSEEQQNDEQNSEQNSQLSNQPDFQALNLQYKFDNQKSRLENDVRVGMQRIESVAQELHLLEQRSTIFGQGFGIARRKHQFFHQESIQVNANYDQIRVIEGKQFSGLFQHETKECARTIIDLLKLRSSYKFESHQEWSGVNDLVVYNKYGEPQITWNEQIEPLPIMEGAEIHEENGIIYTKIDGKLQVQVPSMLTYIQDLIYIMSCIDSGAIRGHCDNRLQYLQQKFEMHQIFNQNLESQDQKNIKRKDFTNIFKVDTHIHHSAAMSAKHLQTFIINKLEENPTEKVGSKDGQRFTLKEIFSELKVNHLELSLDNLDVQADRTLFKRFDKFSNKYNPLGLPKLREVFLKQDNFLKGKYLAELTREMFDILESQKYNGVEWRISVYGKEMDEWNKLAKWFIKHKLQCSKVRWLIQIPRLYSVYKKQNVVQSFQDIIDNIFRPLYDVTINPTIHPFLYQTLFQVVGFDTVDDESCYERISITDLRTSPKDWTSDKDPPYVYWIYYIFANMYTLNALRKERGLNTFKFRPHCGEAGSLDHLATTFLVADGINHGIELNKSPVLTYLFYLSQIGIAMSPVSNNKLFCRYAQSPFLKFFQIGLNVSLSTDDPLILHLTNEPLIEEFAIASQIFDLSAIDLAELSRNSVKQSGFEEPIKSYWAGLNLTNHTLESNNENNNNLPNSRFLYRKQTITEEHEKLEIQAQEIMF